MSTRSAALDLGSLEDFQDEGHADSAAFLRDVLEGLSKPRKTLPCKYLYDARGSMLFDRICELAEYYPTRTELGLLREQADAIAAAIGPDACLVEFGSGASIKVRIVLDALECPRVYVPVDISREHLLASTRALADDYPKLAVIPVCADYTQPFALPDACREGRKVGLFPGSTIGNFTPDAAVAFLTQARATLGSGSHLLIGVDLKKDEKTLWGAYNDSEGVTAAFNMNLLVRINRELGGTFDLGAFEHRAPYNEARGCVEMHLVSRREQTVTIGGRSFDFAAGETIHTEDSHKYAIDEFHALAGRAGWRAIETWTDAEDLFSVHYLAAR